MKRTTLYSTFLLLLCSIPSLALAQDSIFAFDWQPAENDRSVYYLGQIFGSMSTVLQGTGNPLIGNLFSIFNIAVLVLGSIVVSYTIVMATVHTAHEGEVMGKKWSSVWIPLRSAVGIAFLIPTSGGYSLLQVLLMNIIIFGIAAADQLWNIVVDNMSTGLTNPQSTIRMNDGELKTAAERILNNMVCVAVINSDRECQRAVDGRTAAAYETSNGVSFGISGSSDYKTVCGEIQPGSEPSGVYSSDNWKNANNTAFLAAAGGLAPLATAIASGGSTSATNAIFTAMNVLKGNITAVPLQPPPSLDTALKDAKENGWLFAGSYYFVMVRKTANLEYDTPRAQVPSNSEMGKLGSICVENISHAQLEINDYLAETEISGTGEGSNLSLDIPEVSISGKAAEFVDAIATPIRGLVYSLMEYLTTNDPKGPLASLGTFGSNIMGVAETIWFAVIITGLVLLLSGCTMSGIQPMCWSLGAIITILVPILNIIIALLWAVGAMLGIYMPLVPYIVFTFTALGWFVLVIETIVAAPIVALGLVSPAGEQLGKATPALTLLVNVFLRPSLMILGLVTATFLVNAAIGMINYGFKATVQASVAGLGVFGLIALLILYGSLVIAIIHECFSLIHVLPDNIVRWIGGHAEKSNVKDKLSEAKKAVESGASQGAEWMQDSAAWMQEKGKAAKKKGFLGDKGGGGGGGGGGGAIPGGGGMGAMPDSSGGAGGGDSMGTPPLPGKPGKGKGKGGGMPQMPGGMPGGGGGGGGGGMPGGGMPQMPMGGGDDTMGGLGKPDELPIIRKGKDKKGK